MSRLVARAAPYQPLLKGFSLEDWKSRTIDAATVKISAILGLERLVNNFFMWGNGVLTSDGTTAYTGVKKSADGINWSHVGAVATHSQIQGVATDETTLVFLSGANIRYATSPFSSLTSTAHNIDGTYTLTDIAYGEGLFVVVGYKAGVGVGIWTRAGATSGAWTKQTNPSGLAVGAQIRDLRYDPSEGFVAICQDSATSYFCLKSTDGITWTKHAMQSTSSFMEKIAIKENLAVAVTSAGTKMEVSTDGGATWAVVNFFTDLLANEGKQIVPLSLSRTPTGFVVSTRTGTGSTPNWYEEQVYQSEDGVNWLQSPLLPEVLGAAENENAGQFAYSDSLLVHATGNGLNTASAAHAILTTT